MKHLGGVVLVIGILEYVPRTWIYVFTDLRGLLVCLDHVHHISLDLYVSGICLMLSISRSIETTTNIEA